MTERFHFRLWRVGNALRPDPPEVRAALSDVLAAAYAKADAPSGAYLCFPLEPLLQRIPVAALQLHNQAPEQYGEYDRLVAESGFRAGIVPPLVATSVVLSSTISAWILPVGLVFAIVLLWQSNSTRIRALQLLSVSISLGHTTVPLIGSLTEELTNFAPASTNRGAWAAASVVAMDRLGEYEIIEGIINELLSLEDEQEINIFHSSLEESAPDWAEIFVRRRKA